MSYFPIFCYAPVPVAHTYQKELNYCDAVTIIVKKASGFSYYRIELVCVCCISILMAAGSFYSFGVVATGASWYSTIIAAALPIFFPYGRSGFPDTIMKLWWFGYVKTTGWCKYKNYKVSVSNKIMVWVVTHVSLWTWTACYGEVGFCDPQPTPSSSQQGLTLTCFKYKTQLSPYTYNVKY